MHPAVLMRISDIEIYFRVTPFAIEISVFANTKLSFANICDILENTSISTHAMKHSSILIIKSSFGISRYVRICLDMKEA